MIDTSYLIYPENGWGYLTPSREILQMMMEVDCTYEPKNLLEIGFYLGHSTSMWAQMLPDCNIVSCSPPHPRATKYSKVIEQHNENVKVHLIPSPEVYTSIKDIQFDVTFIDGNHDDAQVQLDIEMCRDLEIDILLFDNFELSRVRSGIKKKIGTRPNKIWRYPTSFKGKNTLNEIALFDMNNLLSV